jgi:lipoprotein-anchoring transpeptidase ErfK/SrfK
MRLNTPGFKGIGIHGSTNNESSVPGRGSEGCIRLRDDDLIQLKEKYAFVGMRVVILPDILTE